MRVLIAVDSFKGTLSAVRVTDALAAGWADVDSAAQIRKRPLADGGEGTLDAFRSAVSGAQDISVTVTGPDGFPVSASWLRLPPTASAPNGTGVVELASTSGIELLDELLPVDAHTLGCGQALAAALDAGVSRLVVAIGSSASTDGGAGILRALGARMLDREGFEVPLGARGLSEIVKIDIGQLRRAVPTLVITDVTSPLTGPNGAAAVFGPQKGLTSGDIPRVDAALNHFSRVVSAAFGSRADHRIAGAGAAGGAGFGLHAWGAELVPGAEEVARLVGFEAALADADLVITGEGSFDGQSGAGKVPGFVARAAQRAGVKVAVVAGRIAASASVEEFAAAISLTELAGSIEAAMADPRTYLQQAGRELALL